MFAILDVLDTYLNMAKKKASTRKQKEDVDRISILPYYHVLYCTIYIYTYVFIGILIYLSKP